MVKNEGAYYQRQSAVLCTWLGIQTAGYMTFVFWAYTGEVKKRPFQLLSDLKESSAEKPARYDL